MRLASDNDRTHGLGAEVIALSTDSEARQAAMFARWPTPHVLYVSDPDGERYLRPLDLFDADERGGIGRPGMVVIDPDGNEVYRYVGRDFADRTTDNDVFTAVASLELSAIEPPTGGPSGPAADGLRGFFRPEWLVPYFRGNRFGAVAIAGRITDAESRATATEHSDMCDATLTAWDRLTRTA